MRWNPLFCSAHWRRRFRPHRTIGYSWCRKSGAFFLEPNPNPCLVYQGSAQRDIPEETNGYLFSVSCEGDTVYFDWYHFLMDGHGVSPFLTRILEQYCNLRYGTAFENTPIVCSPAYDIEAMMEKYPSLQPPRARCQRDVVQTYEGRMRRTGCGLDQARSP